MPNWADTRYVDWTSWKAAANHWPNAERRHLDAGRELRAERLRPRVQPPARAAGQLQQPVRRQRAELHRLLGDDEPRDVQRPGRHAQPLAGPERGRLRPRPAPPAPLQEPARRAGRGTTRSRSSGTRCRTRASRRAPQERESIPNGDLVGLTVNFGAGRRPGRHVREPGLHRRLLLPEPGRWELPGYRLEVVDRVGNDSFAPGHGVLLSKSRNSSTPRVWLIDPNPQDIGMVDFYRPDGTPVAVVRGDPRQLNDATFQAGTSSGSEYEYVDTFNRLHFYVLNEHRTADGVLSYDVGVRRFDGAGPFARGVALGESDQDPERPGFLATCTFPLTNTGQAGTGIFDSDIYRVSADVVERRLEGHAPERARGGQGGPDRAGPGARAPRPGRRTTATRARRDADRHVRGDQSKTRRARARCTSATRRLPAGRRHERRSRGRRSPPSPLVLLAGCGGDDTSPAERRTCPARCRPGCVPRPAGTGVEAPDFSAELMDGTPVAASELWNDRPLVLVFTASWCETCTDVHRRSRTRRRRHDGRSRCSGSSRTTTRSRRGLRRRARPR